MTPRCPRDIRPKKLPLWAAFSGQCFGNPNPYNLSKKSGSTPPICAAVRPPPLYRRTFLASKLQRKGNPEIHLPFVLQYASHLYGSTTPICTAILFERYWGLGSPELRVPQKEVGKRSSIAFLIFGTLWVTFRSLFLCGSFKGQHD